MRRLKLDSGVLDATPLNNSSSLFERERMRQHASNPAAGYEVGVTNALTRKVLMRIGRGSNLTITRSGQCQNRLYRSELQMRKQGNKPVVTKATRETTMSRPVKL